MLLVNPRPQSAPMILMGLMLCTVLGVSSARSASAQSMESDSAVQAAEKKMKEIIAADAAKAPPSKPSDDKSQPTPKTSAATVRKFELFVFRKQVYPGCTIGLLGASSPFYPPAIIAYTLELPWRNNTNFISSIPAGSYGGIVRYDHSDHWRIQLVGVPKRTEVQFHIGNVPKNTEGCILVGSKRVPGKCELKGSAAAYKRLKMLFYGSSKPRQSPDVFIAVHVLDM